MNLKDYEAKLKKSEMEIKKELESVKEVTEMGGDVDSFDTETDEAEQFVTNAGVRESLRERLEEVENALNKIRSGGYGKCEKCGNPIEKEVLDVMPESRYCKAHKAR